jgi:hypothetical protein
MVAEGPHENFLPIYRNVWCLNAVENKFKLNRHQIFEHHTGHSTNGNRAASRNTQRCSPHILAQVTASLWHPVSFLTKPPRPYLCRAGTYDGDVSTSSCVLHTFWRHLDRISVWVWRVKQISSRTHRDTDGKLLTQSVLKISPWNLRLARSILNHCHLTTSSITKFLWCQ